MRMAIRWVRKHFTSFNKFCAAHHHRGAAEHDGGLHRDWGGEEPQGEEELKLYKDILFRCLCLD